MQITRSIQSKVVHLKRLVQKLPGGRRLVRIAKVILAQWIQISAAITNRLAVQRYRLSDVQKIAFADLLARLDFNLSPEPVLRGLQRRISSEDFQDLLRVLEWGTNQRRLNGVERGTLTRLSSDQRVDGSPEHLNILFITGEFPNPLHGGGSRVMDFIRALAERHRVFLYSNSFGAEDDAARIVLEKLCERIEVVTLPEFENNPAAISRFIADVAIDVVHYEWPRSLSNFQRSLGRQHIYTCLEPHSLRHLLDLDALEPMSPAWLDKLILVINGLKVETSDMAKVDHCIVVTEQDGRYLQRFNPYVSYSIVNHGFDSQDFCVADQQPEPYTLMYVGNYRHYPNKDAVRYFLKTIMPRIIRHIPEVKLYVVGANVDDEVQHFGDDSHVIVTGMVDNLQPWIQRASVCIAPIITGAGLRTKVVQYAALRRPCVATTIAAADLAFENGTEIIITDDPKAFAAGIIELLRDPARAKLMGEAAYVRARDLYDNRHIVKALETLYH